MEFIPFTGSHSLEATYCRATASFFFATKIVTQLQPRNMVLESHTKVILIKLPKLAMLQDRKQYFFRFGWRFFHLKQTSVRFRFIDSKVFSVHVLLSKNGR